MMGQTVVQDQLFYAFNLEDHVPRDHLLRGVDRFLDLGELRQHLAPFYSHTGRPSTDPELMIRMLVIGYCLGIRSERRLCEEVHLNLAYRWFCRLGLEDSVPDHSTFSKNRHGRFRQSDALRFVFEAVLHRCMSEGLVQGEGFAIDASIIKADANRARNIPGSEVAQWRQGTRCSRAVREYLEALDVTNPVDDDAPEEPNDTEAAPRNISPTDPAARWTAAPGGPAFYAYSTNYLIDLSAGIIMDVEATPAHRTPEVGSTRTMIDRVEQRFDIKPRRPGGRHRVRHRTTAGLDGRRQGDRTSCPCVGQDGTQGRQPVDRRVPVGARAQRVRLPRRPCAAQRPASVHDAANSHHQGRHRHLPSEPGRLRRLCNERSLLSEHAVPQNRSKHP